jgi:glycyl-tRNA synthetase beta chain
MVPTGTADPYALRRQCLGIINIILAGTYNLSLAGLVAASADLLAGKSTRSKDETVKDVLDFFCARLLNQLTGQGMPYDIVDAVLSLGLDNITDSCNRIEALQQMKQDPDFDALSIAFKRVVNILKSGRPDTGVDAAAFEHAAERSLHQKYLEIRDRVRELMEQRQYLDALRLTATIRETVDGFFDNVMVMAEDAKLRANRLALLGDISSMFTSFADFSKLSAE